MLHEWPAFDVSVGGSHVFTVLMIQNVAKDSFDSVTRRFMAPFSILQL